MSSSISVFLWAKRLHWMCFYRSLYHMGHMLRSLNVDLCHSELQKSKKWLPRYTEIYWLFSLKDCHLFCFQADKYIYCVSIENLSNGQINLENVMIKLKKRIVSIDQNIYPTVTISFNIQRFSCFNSDMYIFKQHLLNKTG